MATATILGAAPTLNSVAGVPPVLAGVPPVLAGVPPVLAGALTDTSTAESRLRKRSTQIKYLHSMTKYTLHVWPNGTINGLQNTSNSTTRKYAMLEFITTFFAINSLINQDPKVEIRGVESKMWLCMNRKGDLYATKDKTKDCEFHEFYDEERDCYTYYSVQHPHNTNKTVKWYIALNRHGRTRGAMSSKHKSSRFRITASKESSKVTIELKSSEGKKTKRRYTRLPNNSAAPAKPARTVKNRKIIDKSKSKKKSRKNSKLSSILTSIEQALSASSKDITSLDDFQDSMLIDLGNSDPFINPATQDKIRHSTTKTSSSSKRKKNYSRKSPSL